MTSRSILPSLLQESILSVSNEKTCRVGLAAELQGVRIKLERVMKYGPTIKLEITFPDQDSPYVDFSWLSTKYAGDPQYFLLSP